MSSCRSFYVLPKGSWSPMISEHFWEHTQMPCCISFKRAKVHNEGTIHICVIGRCSVYRSNFKGIIGEKPIEKSWYILISLF